MALRLCRLSFSNMAGPSKTMAWRCHRISVAGWQVSHQRTLEKPRVLRWPPGMAGLFRWPKVECPAAMPPTGLASQGAGLHLRRSQSWLDPSYCAGRTDILFRTLLEKLASAEQRALQRIRWAAPKPGACSVVICVHARSSVCGRHKARDVACALLLPNMGRLLSKYSLTLVD